MIYQYLVSKNMLETFTKHIKIIMAFKISLSSKKRRIKKIKYNIKI